ncbi:MAG: hypothetical protein JXR64_02160 [Spirochaetales bacterium]|nr:hypothetical protein [Spirochaetales bacterium]
MINSIKRFKEKHATAFEFIMFNLLSNIATITNFAILNLGTFLLFKNLSNRDFSFWVFDYPASNGGLGSFLAFLLAYASAQIVNFIVQRKLVFNSNHKLGAAIPIYVVTILVVYVICLYVPTLVMTPLSSVLGNGLAANVTNAINIFIQVVIIYPVLKFVVMKKV